MIAFDVEKLEKEFTHVQFMIANEDEGGKPFLALRFKEGRFSGVVWEYADIQVHIIDGYVDTNFGKVIFVNPDNIDTSPGSDFIIAIGELLDDMLKFSVENE